jgi:hypothetical protein
MKCGNCMDCIKVASTLTPPFLPCNDFKNRVLKFTGEPGVSCSWLFDYICVIFEE